MLPDYILDVSDLNGHSLSEARLFHKLGAEKRSYAGRAAEWAPAQVTTG